MGVGIDRVCRAPRAGSWLVECGGVTAFVDLCDAHGELVWLNRAGTTECLPESSEDHEVSVQPQAERVLLLALEALVARRECLRALGLSAERFGSARCARALGGRVERGRVGS